MSSQEEEKEEEEQEGKEQRELLERYADYELGKVNVLSSEDRQALGELEELPDHYYYHYYYYLGGAQTSPLRSVPSIDLSLFQHLKKIPSQFYSLSKGLQKLDLSFLSKLEEIGNQLCGSCHSLKTVNMKGLTKLRSIGNEVLLETSVTSIDFSNTSPERIGEYFLGSSPIQNLDLSSLLSKVSEIQIGFLSSCRFLVEIDLSNCCNHVTEIQHWFASPCASLTKISLSGLISLKNIGNHFLSNCNSLLELDLSCCAKLEAIGDFFCLGGNSLQKLSMSNLQYLTRIGSNFVNKCPLLSNVNFTGTENLEALGELAFRDCNSLVTLDLVFLSNAKRIGAKFCGRGPDNLIIFTHVPRCQFSNLHTLANVKEIGDPALKEKVRAAVGMMIVRMVYALGFTSSKTVPAGKAIRASRPRRLVIEFLISSPLIKVPFQWGFGETQEERKAVVAAHITRMESQVEEAQKREEAANARTRVAESKLLEKHEEILKLQEKLLDGVIKKYL